jgi:YrbI family 3-deoxy-D-manno-octulosonate 8-phosphate phosphatase
MSNNKTVIVSDIDGVLTDGHFYYSEDGKVLKQFGRNDADALKLFKKLCLKYNIDGEVHFCTSDKNGFKITSRRLQDMGFEADVVSVADRPKWIQENFIDKGYTVYYIGDSFVDIPIMQCVGYDYGMTVKNAYKMLKKFCHFVAKYDGGDGGFAECIFNVICKEFGIDKKDLLLNYI